MVIQSTTFAKMPTGEVAAVVTLLEKNRKVVLGTRRPGVEAEYKCITMYIDALVFTHGWVHSDDFTGKKPRWHGEWEYGSNWSSFEDYYGLDEFSKEVFGINNRQAEKCTFADVVDAKDDDSPLDSLKGLVDKVWGNG